MVVHYELGGTVGIDAGLPVNETWAGGDRGALSTRVPCSVVDSPSTPLDHYIVHHKYSDLVLSKPRMGPASFPNTFHAAINSNPAGLPSRTSDVAEQWTDLSYDKLGRPTRLSR